MRGDKQWFDDCIAQAELETKFQNLMLDMGLSVYHDPGFAAWFHFQSCARFAYKPCWMHETFKDYGGYQAYLTHGELGESEIESCEGCGFSLVGCSCGDRYTDEARMRTDYCKVCGIPRYIHDHPTARFDHTWLSTNTH